MKEVFDSKYMVCVKCMTYNQSDLIKDALNGFCNQKTDFPYVCIIVDDASTDGEQDVIMSYFQENFYTDNESVFFKETEDFVLYSAKHNSNVNCSFVVLLLKYNHYGKKSKESYFSDWSNNSRYIAICEGDDYWIDNLKLKKQVGYMELHPKCSMSCHNAYKENASTGKRMGTLKIYSHNRNAKRVHLFRDGGFIPTASYLMRQSLFKDFSSFPVHKKAGDIRIQVYASIVGDVYYFNEPMSVYRLNDKSVTHSAMKDIQKSIERQEYSISWYKIADNYTRFKYHKEFDASIAFCEARIIRFQGRYIKLWNPRYWQYLFSLKLTTRLALFAGMFGLSFVPTIGKAMKNVRGGVLRFIKNHAFLF